MDMLPPELIISIAEKLDMISLFNFMRANKSLAALIKSYEHSICRTEIGMFAVRPEGKILSSAGIQRRICEQLTFPCIRELELRESRVNEIVSDGFIKLSWPPGPSPLTPVQHGRLAAVLKQSLLLCDAIADVAANIQNGVIPEIHYAMISSGYWNLPSSLLAENRHRDPFANINARLAQIDYMRRISVEDLAGIYLTVMAASSVLIQDRPAIQQDPNFAERITVFEECVLRHGTWFLWAQAVDEASQKKIADQENNDGNFSLREMTNHMLLAGFSELIGWETGAEELPPGLRMSLLDVAKGHFEDKERPVVFQLFKVLRRMVIGTEEDDDEADDDLDVKG